MCASCNRLSVEGVYRGLCEMLGNCCWGMVAAQIDY